MLKRMKEPQYTEPSIAWAADDEHSGVTKYKPGGSRQTSALLPEAPKRAGEGSSPAPPVPLLEALR